MTPQPSGSPTRDALMKAAADLLVEVGYADMTTAAVARRAGVAEGTIYRHFKSKEALAEAVFGLAWEELFEAMEAALPGRDQPGARLRAFLPLSLRVFGDRPCDSALCNQEHMYWMNTVGLQVLPPGPERFVGLLEEAIRLAQRAGEAREDLDARIVANFLFHGVGHLMERFLKPTPEGGAPAYTVEAFLAAMDVFLDPVFYPEHA